MKERVLVTGASGLIGRRVVELLRGSGDLVVLVRTASAASEGVDAIVADLADPGFAQRLPSRMDAVVHLAQSPDFADFPRGAPAVFRVNTAAFSQLLDWASRAGVRHFVHASTGGLYGRGPRPFVEDDAIQCQGPLAHYFATKMAAELLATAYGCIFSVTALRFFFVYGPGQKETMLIPRLARSIASGKPVALAGEHGMLLNPVFVDDAAAAVLAALRLDQSTVVNVAGAETLSIRGIAETIGKAVGRPPVFRESGDPPGHDLVADITRMRTLLYTPAVNFRDGVERLTQTICAATSE